MRVNPTDDDAELMGALKLPFRVQCSISCCYPKDGYADEVTLTHLTGQERTGRIDWVGPQERPTPRKQKRYTVEQIVYALKQLVPDLSLDQHIL